MSLQAAINFSAQYRNLNSSSFNGFLHAISTAAELPCMACVQGCAQAPSEAGRALGVRDQVQLPWVGNTACRVKHTQGSWTGLGCFLPLFFAGCTGLVLVWEQRKGMGSSSTVLCFSGTSGTRCGCSAWGRLAEGSSTKGADTRGT